MASLTVSEREVGQLNPLEIYKLRLHHRLSYPQIAKLTGKSIDTVHTCFHRFLDRLGSPADVEAYENSKKELLSLTEERLVATLTDPDKLEKASLNNVAYALTQVHTALRLEKGKSTSNINALAQVIVKAHEMAYPRQDRRADTTSNRQVTVSTQAETVESE